MKFDGGNFGNKSDNDEVFDAMDEVSCGEKEKAW